MDFFIGQTFSREEGYPPEAAFWCNNRGDCYIVETVDGFSIAKIPEPTPEELALQELTKAKFERAQAVRSIRVTIGDKVFDGDEAAQSRMARAIQVAEISGLDTTEWVLANNEVSVVTLAEMKEALSKAMLEMGRLWTKPYTEVKQ